MSRASDYEINLVTTDAELRALKPEWERLYAVSRPLNPFLSYAWTEACREQFCRSSRLFILTASRAGKVAAIAPLRMDRQVIFRVLRFIGDGRSDYLGFLVDPAEAGAGRALLEALAQRSGRWDLAVLRQLSEVYSPLAGAALPDGLKGHGVEGTVAPYLRSEQGWEELLKTGPGWLRRMQKAARRWERDGGTVERYVGAEAAALAGAVSDVEARSWKGAEGVARFQPGRDQEFLRRVLAALGAAGEMELWLARMEGRPVAFEINFLAPERIRLYQGAYDEAFRKYSPGGVLDFLSIERAWKAGAREYDFMSGDEPYKAERTDATRPIRYRALFPDGPRGQLAFALLIAPRWQLKQQAAARVAHQLWVQWKNHPARLLAAGLSALRRAQP